MLMISKTKLDESIPENLILTWMHLVIILNTTRLLDLTVIKLESIPAKLQSYDIPFIESFCVEINLHKRN